MKTRKSSDRPFLNDLTLYLTEDCNFRCRYCYQPRGKRRLSLPAILKAVDYFMPRLNQACTIGFYGGEPLLEYETIRAIVDYIDRKNRRDKKNILYSITTNGSLINDENLRFFCDHNFLIILSFDLLAQDINRKEGSFKHLECVLEKILNRPEIQLDVNCVFTPQTCNLLYRSVKYVIEKGVREFYVDFSTHMRWPEKSRVTLKSQLAKTRKYLLEVFTRTGEIPMRNFRDSVGPSIMVCSAGSDQMALGPDGKLWGCFLFIDYFRKYKRPVEYLRYCWGSLDSITAEGNGLNETVLLHYGELKQTDFSVPGLDCIDCPSLFECRVCPVEAGLYSKKIGNIPDWYCEMGDILRRQHRLFRNNIESTEKRTEGD